MSQTKNSMRCFFPNFLRQRKKNRNTPVRPRCIYYTGFEFLSSVTFSSILHKIKTHEKNEKISWIRARFTFVPFDFYFADYNNNSPCGSFTNAFLCKCWIESVWDKTFYWDFDMFRNFVEYFHLYVSRFWFVCILLLCLNKLLLHERLILTGRILWRTVL